MRTTTLAAATAAAVLAATAAAQAGPNLVTNGGFSSSNTSVNSEFGPRNPGPIVDGWTGGNGYDIWFSSAAASNTVNVAGEYSGSGKEKLYGPVSASPGGGSFIGLDGEQTAGVQGSVSQTISGLTVGSSYLLTFDWAAGQLQSRTGATTDQFQVTLGSQVKSTNVVSNPSGGFTGWFSAAMYFTATSTSEVLSFLSVGTPQGLPPMGLLDDVSLVNVPEPATLAVLGLSLVGIGYTRRRRA